MLVPEYTLVGQFWHEIVITVMIAVLGAIAMYPVRKLKKAYTDLMQAVHSTKAELCLQRENCLTTLQQQGAEQVRVLAKVSDTLDGVRLDLAEQTGILRTGASRRRAKRL